MTSQSGPLPKKAQIRASFSSSFRFNLGRNELSDSTQAVGKRACTKVLGMGDSYRMGNSRIGDCLLAAKTDRLGLLEVFGFFFRIGKVL